MKRKFLASILCILIYPNPLNADGIVFDPSVYGQAVATVSQLASQAATQANQYAKQLLQYQTQLQQYATQLQQYQNMVTNTLAPAAYIWDQANATISKVVGIVDTIDYYANQAGGLQNYLAQFQNSSYYRSSPCYTATGCPPDYLQTLTPQQTPGSAAQKSANDALLTMVQQQQTQLNADAASLVNLQANAQGAQGQMQALGAANQLASAEANQLMQIRAILIAQQNAAATMAEVAGDRQARQQAADAAFNSYTFTPSPVVGW